MKIPAGTTARGSEDGQPDEQPVRRVFVDAFALAAHPVTNREYRVFVESTGRNAPSVWSDLQFTRPEQPVVAVSWFDAVAYCAWLRDATGEPFRLPTEAEREKAARGGLADARYPWGDDVPGGELAAEAGLPDISSAAPNGYGLHHMGDLVHEWCADWYDANYYRDSPSRNPTGPREGTRRVSRGGSWRHRVPFTRCAARSSIPPDRTYADYGFRVAVGS